MKRHTKNIAAVALLALAGGAFIVDRFVLGYSGPQAAAAETTADLLAASPKSGPAATSATAKAPSIADRIAQLGVRVAALPEPESPDAFVIPAVWRAELTGTALPTGDSSAPSASAPKPEPINLTLTAVIAGDSADSSAATINGRVIRVGRRINGFTLLRVDGSASPTAVLQGPDGEITLHTRLEDTIRSAQDRGDAEPMIKPHRQD